MKAPNDDGDDLLGDALSSYDDLLSKGGVPPFDFSSPLSCSQRRLFQSAMNGIAWMERVWPRTNSNPHRKLLPHKLLDADELSDTGRIGKYEILGELGQGGAGIVFLALDSTTGRRVALKVPRVETLGDPDLRRRFLTEARITVGLSHPGLVPVIEAGEIGSLCFIAVAYVGEMSLSTWLERRESPIPFATAAALTAAVARAVDYLHEHHILHRDIKPSNILLGSTDSRTPLSLELAEVGFPRLTDFGLAKYCNSASPDLGSVGGPSNVLLGTPEYMAPEQIGARQEPLGRQSDVYSLGVVLFELITGSLPFEGRNRFQMLQRAVSEDPSSLAARRQGVPRALEAICSKCLEKVPNRRYATAAQLADDLQRFMAGLPTIARRPSLWKRAHAWAKRKQRLLRVVGLAGCLIVSVLAASIVHRTRAEAARAEASNRLTAAWDARSHSIRLLKRGDLALGLLWLTKALETAPRSAPELADLLRYDLGSWIDRTPVLMAELPHPRPIRAIHVSPDGQTVLTCCYDNQVRLWEAMTGRLLCPPLVHPNVPLKARCEREAVITACQDGVVRRWCSRTGRLIEDEGSIEKAKRPSTTSQAVARMLWEFEVGSAPAVEFADLAVVSKLEYNARSRKVLTVEWGGEAKLWSVDRPRSPRLSIQSSGRLQDAVISPDGSRTALVEERLVRFLGANSKIDVLPPIELSASALAIAFAPSGDTIATGDADAMQFWELPSRRLAFRVSGHGSVESIAFSPNGEIVCAGYGDHMVRLWRLPPSSREPACHPLVIDQPGSQTGRPPVAERGFDGILSLAFHPDGKQFYSSGVDHGVRSWDLKSGECSEPFACHEDVVSKLAISQDGTKLVTGGRDRRVCIWDLDAKEKPAREMTQPFWVGGVAAGRGDLVALGFLGIDDFQVWGSAGQRIDAFGPFHGVYDLAFDPGGTRVLVGTGADAFICDLKNKYRHPFHQKGVVFSVAWHPDGQTVVTGTKDGDLAWWNANTMQSLGSAPAHSSKLERIAYSPNGDLVVTVGADERLRFWHDRTREPIGSAIRLTSRGQSVAFHPNSELAIAGSQDGRIHFVTAPRRVSAEPERLRRWIESAVGMILGPGDVPQRITLTERREVMSSDEVNEDARAPAWLFN